MNKTQAGRMLTMAAFIKKLPRHNLNQCLWVHLDKAEVLDDLRNPQCKSSCCALGWTAAMDPKQWHFRFDELGFPEIVHRKSGLDFLNGACEYFGISMDEARKLFGSTQRTPARQAAIMRKIVAKHGWEEA